MKLFSILFLLTLSLSTMQAQETKALPYHQIPEAPATYESGNILSRFLDGLGYRYYWATEGLREEDLAYAPSDEARSTFQTLEHIYGLSNMILNGAQNTPNIRPVEKKEMDYEALRTQTLLNIQKASELCRGKTAEEVAELSIIFQFGERKNEVPYWNMMNGPIADAIYHVGQIVSFRRSSGNSMNPKVNVFSGKNRE